MAKKPAKVHTFHPLAVIKSMEHQNETVAKLLLAARTVVNLNHGAPGTEALTDAINECRTAMYPEEAA